MLESAEATSSQLDREVTDITTCPGLCETVTQGHAAVKTASEANFRDTGMQFTGPAGVDIQREHMPVQYSHMLLTYDLKINSTTCSFKAGVSL